MGKRTVIRNILKCFFLLHSLFNVYCKDYFNLKADKESKRLLFFVELVSSNLKTNGWNNIIVFGNFPNHFYLDLKTAVERYNSYTLVVSNYDDDVYFIEDVVPYKSNTVILNCQDFSHFEGSLLKVMSFVFWHPHANVYLYYHAKESQENIARMFFIFWYYRASNVALIQHDDDEEQFLISQYSPFASEDYLEVKYGCWTAKKIGMPISTFDESFVCETDCHNVSVLSKRRSTSLGTCIGIILHVMTYENTDAIKKFDLFEDKGKNFHGFRFRAFATEILPFMQIQEYPNNTYKLGGRDGAIWNTLSELMNFSLDLSSVKHVIKEPFQYEVNTQQLFAVAHRKGDLCLIPIYQFDLIVVEIDYTFAFKESGLCFVSHRAGFETVLFDLTTLTQNYDIILKLLLSFVCIWFLFCVFTKKDCDKINMDFIGKNFMNSVRCVLLVNLYSQPKNLSFRVFLAIIIWSFFVINFATQASIISFFTAFKRKRDVDTFDDIIEKGYSIEGLSSPDAVLPETEERFHKINSKLSPVTDMYGCVKALMNDSHRFCLQDCAVGRYLERNMLNEKGDQYLHIAKDRIHSHYLSFLLPKHSVLTDTLNKYMMLFFEAGLIKKWEDYRFSDLKEEVHTKPLSMNDVKGIFYVYGISVAGTIVIFILELCSGKFCQLNEKT